MSDVGKKKKKKKHTQNFSGHIWVCGLSSTGCPFVRIAKKKKKKKKRILAKKNQSFFGHVSLQCM
jgi:epoxyqueuosine reductase QueG